MKKIKRVISIAAVLLTIVSCSKDDVNKISVSDSTTMATGSWKVTYYFDNSNGVSNDFDGFSFAFNDDGTLTATIGAESFTGTWSIQSSDDDPNFDKEMEITISGSSLMDELNHKWLITELTDATMHLKDDSGSEEIHFEKI